MQQSLLQSKYWADFKSKWGWEAHQIGDYFALEKKLFKDKTFLYLPEVNLKYDEIALAKAMINRHPSVTSGKAIFAQLEILAPMNLKFATTLDGLGFVKAKEEIQPKWRQIIPLNIGPDQILAQMKQRGRRNLRIAQNSGVVISLSEDPIRANMDAENFYQIFKQTSRRHGFGVRPKQYFVDLLEMLYKNKLGFTVYARKGNEIMSMLIITIYEEVASYLYGASADENNQIMASYLAQWQAMLEAKARGAQTYDLLAIAPPETKNHRFSGITRFKTAFGGNTLELVGSYNLIFNKGQYQSFVLADKIRRTGLIHKGVSTLRSIKKLYKVD